MSKGVTSVDYLACAKDHQGKGVGSALAQSFNGPQTTDAWLLVSKNVGCLRAAAGMWRKKQQGQRSQPSKKATTAPTQVCASASQGWCSAKLRVRKSKSLVLGKLHDTACWELLIVKVRRARGEAKQQNQQQKKE